MTDTTPAEGTEHPGCTECGGTGTVYLPDVDGWHPEPCDAYAPAEGTEGHEHDWVDATATGARVAAYCDVWGCTATKPRPTPPVPAAEDDAVDPWRVAHERDTAIWADAHRGLMAERDQARQQLADLRAGIETLRDKAARLGLDEAAEDANDLLADPGGQVGDETGARCCTAPDCCGPGSWCCIRAGAHTHEPGDDEHLPGVNVTQQVVPDSTKPAPSSAKTGRNDRPAPVVPDSAGLRERVDKAIEDVLCEHRIVTLHGQPGERYRCEASGCDYDTEDWTAWEEHVAPFVRAAVLAAVTVEQVNRLLGVGLWDVSSFCADARIDFHEDALDDVLAVVGQGVTAEQAWREGFDLGTAHGIAYQAGNDEAWSPPPNPYRAVVRSGEPAPSTTTEGES